jgi:excisionase family DNA binding protein
MYEGWMRTGEAASRLGISRTAVNRLIARGTLVARFVGGCSWIRIQDLRKLAADPEYRKATRGADFALLDDLVGQLRIEILDKEEGA